MHVVSARESVHIFEEGVLIRGLLTGEHHLLLLPLAEDTLHPRCEGDEDDGCEAQRHSHGHGLRDAAGLQGEATSRFRRVGEKQQRNQRSIRCGGTKSSGGFLREADSMRGSSP